MVQTLGTLITRNTVVPMVGVKVSKEGSERSQFGQNMSRERNEHAVKSGIEGMQKGYFTPALLFPIKKKKRKNKKTKNWDTCTGTGLTCTDTAIAKSGRGQPVPVQPGVFWAVKVFKPLFIIIFIPLSSPHHIRTTLAFFVLSHKVNSSLHVPASDSIILIQTLLSSWYRRGKPLQFLESVVSVILHYYTWICLVCLGWWCSFLGGLGLWLVVWGEGFYLICTGPA